MRRNLADYSLITLKGIAMGAADVVPGVSGGTIAFISGIYQELINTLNNINFSVVTVFKKQGLKAAWKQLNGNFLLALVSGIALSILSFAKLITYLLEHYPMQVWAFFFGLVVASIFLIWKEITKFNPQTIVLLLAGIAISYYITIARPTASPDSYGYLFLSGFIAIIAMILPGISGAFILLLMGSYETVIGTINQFRAALFAMDLEKLSGAVLKLLTFAFGAVLGLKLFSKILHWMFDHHKNATLAMLLGFMVGSLNKLWPWKEILETRINSHGEKVPFIEKSVLPGSFQGDPKIVQITGIALAGFLLIYLLEKTAAKFGKAKTA